MKLLRGATAMLAFLVGLIALAGGLYGVAVAWAVSAQTHQPMDPWTLAGGLIACAVGILFLFLSRTIDPEHGPVRSYRSRPRKRRASA